MSDDGQLSFFEEQDEDFSGLSDATIQARFENFDREHPEVMRFFLNRLNQLKQRGFQHYGMKSLFELARWHFRIDQGDEEFKLNNNYHSRYARKIMAEYRDFDGFFETRELKAAG